MNILIVALVVYAVLSLRGFPTMADVWKALGFPNDRDRDQQQRAQEGARIQQTAAEGANRLYAEYAQEALAAQQAGLGAGLISQFGLANIADLIQRQALNQAQRERLPYQMGGLSALQSLPVLQALSGVPAYALPRSVSQYDWMANRPDYASVLRSALAYSQGGGNQGTPTTPPVTQPAASLAVPTPPSTVSTPGGAGGGMKWIWSPQTRAYVPNPLGYGVTFDEIPPNMPVSGTERNVAGLGQPVPRPVPKEQFAVQNPQMVEVPGQAVGAAGAAVPVQGNIAVGDIPVGGQVPEGWKLPPGWMWDETTGTYRLVNDFVTGTPGTETPPTSTELVPTTPEFSFRDSPLYQFRKREAEKAMGRAQRARGIYESETGALLGAQEQERIAAEEAENQYNRVLNLVKIGMGEAASATGSLPIKAGTTLGEISSGLGGDVGNAFNQAATQRSGLYEKLGTGLAENRAQIGQAAGTVASLGYAPSSGNNFLNTLLKGYQLYSGLGGGDGNLFSGGGSGNFPGATGGGFLPAGAYATMPTPGSTPYGPWF